MSSISATPVAQHFTEILRSPTDNWFPSDHAHAPAPAGQGQGNATQAAFETYTPKTGDTDARRLLSVSGKTSANVGAARIGHDTVGIDGVDGMALVEKIAKDWEAKGVDPAWIKVIRNPDRWTHAFESDRPALEKLAEALRGRDEFPALRRQASHLMRGTPAWARLMELRKLEQPQESQEAREQGLARQLYDWKSDFRGNAQVMYMIVKGKEIADKFA